MPQINIEIGLMPQINIEVGLKPQGNIEIGLNRSYFDKIQSRNSEVFHLICESCDFLIEVILFFLLLYKQFDES